jgi:hypothetical protein
VLSKKFGLKTSKIENYGSLTVIGMCKHLTIIPHDFTNPREVTPSRCCGESRGSDSGPGKLQLQTFSLHRALQVGRAPLSELGMQGTSCSCPLPQEAEDPREIPTIFVQPHSIAWTLSSPRPNLNDPELTSGTEFPKHPFLFKKQHLIKVCNSLLASGRNKRRL